MQQISFINNNLTFIYGNLGIDNDKYFFENPKFGIKGVETINMTSIYKIEDISSSGFWNYLCKKYILVSILIILSIL